MLKVFKYHVSIADRFNLKLPLGAQVLRVDYQPGGGGVQMWALVNPKERDFREREFRFADTGHVIEESLENLKYINTFFMQEGQLVFHIFEVLK